MQFHFLFWLGGTKMYEIPRVETDIKLWAVYSMTFLFIDDVATDADVGRFLRAESSV
jgi:hypothetical protein